IAVDQEQDNLRGALEWAVANDDAETALTIAGGVCWPYWLAGTAVEAKRWLDDAFRCKGEVSERARALALTGRGLIEFQLGKPENVDADLSAALAIFRDLNDLGAISLTHSFYAEVAAARGDIDEGRRRRRDLLDHYVGLPDSTFVIAARAYSRAKLAGLDSDLELSERYYREAAAAFSQIDRPMMLAMCRGTIADFDERCGNYRAAIDNLDEAVATNDALGLRGFNGSLLARLGWALLQDGDVARAEVAYDRALDLARRLSNTPVIFIALAGRAVLHRLDGRNASAAAAATEALELYLAGEPRRLANRVDPRADLLAGAAVCCTELGILGLIALNPGNAGNAGNADNAEHAVRLLGHAERLRSEAGVAVPKFQCDGLERALESASAELSPETVRAALDFGQQGRLGHSVTLTP
ncbi:MAG: hypothetical protein QOC57_2237, partial [Ilumatobacteraceae bacterium]